MIRRKERKEGIVPKDNWANPMAVMNDMDRIFDEFRSEWERAFLVPRAFSAELVRAPLIDLTDDGRAYVLKAEVPGLNREDINIEVGENEVEISGETKSEAKEEDKEKGFIRRERRYTKFYRSLPLPDAVLAEEVDAELKDGVLTVKLPKAAPTEKKATKVQVR